MRYFLVFLTGLLMVVLAPFFLAQARMAEVSDETQALMLDIHSLNLINGMNLSGNQMQALLAKAREAKQANDTYTGIVSSREKEFQNALTALRSELLRTPDPSPSIERQYHAVHGDLEKARDNYEDKMKSLVSDLKQILNENQLVIAAEYSPCLIPKRDVRNPERIGQASGLSHIEDMLARMRQVPQDRFDKMKDKLTEKAKKAMKHHYSDEEIPKKLAELDAAIKQARSLSEEEFQVKKAQLAEKIAPPRHEARKGKALDLMLARHLLNPNFAALLQQKLATAQR
ncbi:MAG: hypothetical protein HYU64_02105 [Armatimonadetes bacterium]|nr:hypothetical protein [Armatimonadota bacterium]